MDRQEVRLGGELYGTASYYDHGPGVIVYHDFEPSHPEFVPAHRLTVNYITGKIVFVNEDRKAFKTMEFDLKLVA